MNFLSATRQKLNRLKASLRYATAGGKAPAVHSQSLSAALAWLCRCQDVTSCGGFSRAYSLINGWALPYPETTGYIICSFSKLAEFFPELHLMERARLAGRWLAEIQFESGAICAKQYYPGNTEPSVFNTGMVLHGWSSLIGIDVPERWLPPSRKAADWILEQQEPDGSWIQHSYCGIPHTYYTMVDWALLRFWKATGEEKYRVAAERHLGWVLAQQRANGWFEHCEFFPGDPVTTHTLSYTTQGLVESGALLGHGKYVEAAQAATKPLFEVFRERQTIPAVFSAEWQPLATWECLTGSAQTALVWKGLGTILGDERWIRAGELLDRKLMSHQRVSCIDRGVDGGIPGSWPIGGNYDPYALPNHAAKFFVDSLSSGLGTPPAASAE